MARRQLLKAFAAPHGVTVFASLRIKGTFHCRNILSSFDVVSQVSSPRRALVRTWNSASWECRFLHIVQTAAALGAMATTATTSYWFTTAYLGAAVEIFQCV